MFKESHVTELDSWTVVEEADVLPAVSYPAFIGTGRLGVGLDAAGLQSLEESLGEHFNCFAKPMHSTQADLYVLHDGMISSHLFDDEIIHTGTDPRQVSLPREYHRNFMPLGYLEQSFEFDCEEMAKGTFEMRRSRRFVEASEIREHARTWRREWSLRKAIVKTFFEIGLHKRFKISAEVFAPFKSESVYVRLTRHAHPDKPDGQFKWKVSLPLKTRHGLKLFQEGCVKVGRHCLLCKIDEKSQHLPAEPYAAVYGIAADGAEVKPDSEGWSVTMEGSLSQSQTAFIRMDFCRHAGGEVESAPVCFENLEEELDRFVRESYEQALGDHIRDWEVFWNSAADIVVEHAQHPDVERRFMLHMSEYLLRCGNDQSMGGTVQFLLMHMNGWTASNFHDNHYIADGLARANIFEPAVENVKWMRHVMSPQGRAFPWKITYDGVSAVPPEQDTAPMSDTNRALLAMRIYELAGENRDALLRSTVYPILCRVADMAVSEWFVEHDGMLLLKKVMCDTVGSWGEPEEHELGTVCTFITVLRKAAQYSEKLGVDEDRRRIWKATAERIALPKANGKYAADTEWFYLGYYVSEAWEYLDPDAFRITIDSFGPRMPCNYPWLNSAGACAEIRLGRPDRAEQLMTESIARCVHGPGYFEEMRPVGTFALPPLATAHGAYVTACCEQILLNDFWKPRIFIGKGLASVNRNRHIRFSGLRAVGGAVVSGLLTPNELKVGLYASGEPIELQVNLRLPCRIGLSFSVCCDGKPIDYQFHGESISAEISLKSGEEIELAVRNKINGCN